MLEESVFARRTISHNLPVLPHLRVAHLQARRSAISDLIWMLGILGMTSLIGFMMLRDGPSPAILAWIAYLLGIAAIVYRPRYGVYLIVFFTLLGDALLSPWYPFNKNFSSFESLLFLNNSVSFTPLESYLGLTLISWLSRMAFTRQWKVYWGPLSIPVLTFIAFIAFSLFYGILTGGNLTMALWQSRTIFYLPMMVLFVGNLIERREHISWLMWAIILPICIDGISGSTYVATVLQFDLGGVERIAEHSLSIHFNAIYIILCAIVMFRASSSKRTVIISMLPFVMLAYVANNRRASFISLGIVLVLMAIVLYRVNRKAFWLIVPMVAAIGIAYTVVFWNAGGPLGAPAKAVRSVIGEPDLRDASSNIYREQENLNILFNIHSKPLTGIGFGNRFYIIVQMADISNNFPFYEYLTHNSFLWIWMYAGAGAFFSLLILIGMSIVVGVRTLYRMPGGDLSMTAAFAVLYVIMHFIYTYVDMSWEGQSMILVGTSMGLINSLMHIVAKPVPIPRKRWNWQPDPKPVPGLV